MKKFTLVLFFLQDAAHHLLPEPSITPEPWKTAFFNLEKSSQTRGSFGSSGATSVPSIWRNATTLNCLKFLVWFIKFRPNS